MATTPFMARHGLTIPTGSSFKVGNATVYTTANSNYFKVSTEASGANSFVSIDTASANPMVIIKADEVNGYYPELKFLSIGGGYAGRILGYSNSYLLYYADNFAFYNKASTVLLNLYSNGQLQVATSFFVGNSTVNVSSNSTVVSIGSATINSTFAALTANNATYLNGAAASAYQTTAGLAANVATMSANNASYLGGTAAASFQLNSTLAANVATMSANNASYLGGTAAASFQLNSTLAANVATMSANNASYLGGIAAATYATLTSPTFNSAINISGVTPELRFYDTNAGTNEKFWRIYGDGQYLYCQAVNDAYNAAANLWYGARNANNYSISGMFFETSLTATSYNTSSDKKMKTKVKATKKDKSERVLNLKFVDYSMKTEPDVRRTGLIAQDVEQIFPEYVHKDGKGNLTLDYNSIIMCFLKKVQEQEQRLQILEKTSG